VSEIHANFVINRGGATYNDVATLIDIIRAEILARTGIELETEVRRWT
jgi:UDP-N-acetylmuramate dehydrogenase